MNKPSDSVGEQRPSPRVVEQRVRNRVLEYFELVASIDRQREYERLAPLWVNVPSEIINQWEDWVPSGQELLDIYSPDEVEAIGTYRDAWEAAVTATPDTYPSLDEVLELEEWREMIEASQRALAIFEVRGRFPEDVEVP